jgi:hypothetical protein
VPGGWTRDSYGVVKFGIFVGERSKHLGRWYTRCTKLIKLLALDSQLVLHLLARGLRSGSELVGTLARQHSRVVQLPEGALWPILETHAERRKNIISHPVTEIEVGCHSLLASCGRRNCINPLGHGVKYAWEH